MKRFMLLLTVGIILGGCSSEEESSETTTSESVEETTSVSETTTSESEMEEETTTAEVTDDFAVYDLNGNPMTKEDIYADLSGKSFVYGSGAGAWRSELTFDENGEFTASYLDSNMGGTSYSSEYRGKFSITEPLDTYRAILVVEDVEVTTPTGDTYEIEGFPVEYVEDAVGVDASEEFVLYLPGYPVDELSEMLTYKIGGMMMIPEEGILGRYAIDPVDDENAAWSENIEEN